MPDLYLFDTNILVHLVRESAIGDYDRPTYQPLMADLAPSDQRGDGRRAPLARTPVAVGEAED